MEALISLFAVMAVIGSIIAVWLNTKVNEKLVGLKKDLFYLRMQHATNQLDNPLKIRETKHDIARVKTMLRQKELSGASDKQ